MPLDMETLKKPDLTDVRDFGERDAGERGVGGRGAGERGADGWSSLFYIGHLSSEKSTVLLFLF